LPTTCWPFNSPAILGLKFDGIAAEKKRSGSSPDFAIARNNLEMAGTGSEKNAGFAGCRSDAEDCDYSENHIQKPISHAAFDFSRYMNKRTLVTKPLTRA